MRVHGDREAEVRRQVAADLTPLAAGVVGAHDVPVLLHEQGVRSRRVLGEPMHAVADLGVLVGDLAGPQALVDRQPARAAVVAAERAGGRDRHVDPVGVDRVEDDRVQAQAAGAGLPRRTGGVVAERGELLPLLAGVTGHVQGGVLGPGVDRVRVGAGGLEVPDPLELPRPGRAVVPEVVDGLALVGEVVANGVPALAAVVGALHHLPEPAPRGRGVEAVRIGRRAVDVVDLPAAEVRAVDGPVGPRAVRGQDERALACAYEHPYTGHCWSPSIDSDVGPVLPRGCDKRRPGGLRRR